jgi:hypothetical protein
MTEPDASIDPVQPEAEVPLEELYDTTSETVTAVVEAEGAHVHVTWTGADGIARAVSGFVVPGEVEEADGE